MTSVERSAIYRCLFDMGERCIEHSPLASSVTILPRSRISQRSHHAAGTIALAFSWLMQNLKSTNSFLNSGGKRPRFVE